MTEKNTGFDPTVVAQFFRTLEEFRAGNAEFQRQMLLTVDSLRQDIKELRKEIQEVRQQLADGNRTFGVLEQRLKTHDEWRQGKEEECRRHQMETLALRDEMTRIRAAGTGISLVWKVIIGAVGLLGSVTGLLIAWKVLEK